MLKRLTIVLPESVADRLDHLARDQFRDRKQQAVVLLLDAIERAEEPPMKADQRRKAEPPQ